VGRLYYRHIRDTEDISYGVRNHIQWLRYTPWTLLNPVHILVCTSILIFHEGGKEPKWRQETGQETGTETPFLALFLAGDRPQSQM